MRSLRISHCACFFFVALSVSTVAGHQAATKKAPGKGNDIPTGEKSQSCAGDTIPIGALTSGSDADALAQTLSSVFRDSFIVTACSSSSKGDGDQSSVPSSDSKPSLKDSLLVKPRGKPSSCPANPAQPNVRCDLQGAAISLDRDNFKGLALNSNYVVHVEGLAAGFAASFPHPVPDIDVEQAGDGRGRKSNDFIILIPSPAVLGQPSSQNIVSKHAAGLNEDFQRVSKLAEASAAPACDEPCLAKEIALLSTLDPRDVAVSAPNLFHGRYVRTFPLNHGISLT
jgi:hypothetical protein